MAFDNCNFSQFIDGKFTEGQGPDLAVENPYTEKTITTVKCTSVVETNAAIESASKACFEGPWSNFTRKERGNTLRKMAEHLETRKKDLTSVQIAEVGMFRMMCGYVGTEAPIDIWHQHAELAARDWDEALAPFVSQTAMGPKQYSGIVLQEPIGVVSAIVPFNFPIFVATLKTAAALAAGCSVILKASELTPLSCTIIAEAAAAADLPPGVLQYIIGEGDVGRRMVAHDKVDCVSFTGSTKIGAAIAAEAGQGLKKVVMELGGKSAAIICEDADLGEAVGALVGSFANAGQGCGITSRFVVNEKIADQLVQTASMVMGTLTAGDPDSATTTHSPQISKAAKERIMGFIDSAPSEGATLVTGGTGIDDQPHGHWIKPTLFDNVDQNSKIAQEELFGPVVAITRVKNDEEAIAVANNSDYGLWGTVCTKNPMKGMKIARKIRTGNFGINGGVLNINAPFGGTKKSGFGREMGEYGVREFFNSKSVSYS